MDIKRVITDRIKKMAGGGIASPVAEQYISNETASLWREEMSRWPDEELAALDRPVQERCAELGRRLQSAPEGPLKPYLVRELLANVRELTAARTERERIRQSELSEGTRNFQRSSNSYELKHAHLQDERQHCDDLIAQEYRRRGLRLPTEDERKQAGGMYGQLFQLFKAISHAGSQRMQAAGSDPILAELETLLAADDSTTIEQFPEWLKKPAAKLLSVVQERNRYKRLLKSRGLLPETA